MARVREGRDGIEVELAGTEIELLSRLLDGLAGRLRAGGDDAVIDRLAPSGSRGDAEADAELRRMVRNDLLEGRAERLARLAVDIRGWAPSGSRDAVRASLGEDEAMLLLGGLNDLRLALGASIAIGTFERSELEPSDPRSVTLELMDRLGGLQQGLVEHLDV